MINSKEDLVEYIRLDEIASGGESNFLDTIVEFTRPSIRRYQVKLRKAEYAYNCRRRNVLEKLLCMIRCNSLKRYGLKLGFSIPLNVFGPGLCIAHAGTIVVNGNVRIGSNARIHVGVNIGNSSELGEKHTNNNVPQIGNNVYIGPGAKIFGKINIGNNVRIGANSVVNRDVPDNVTVAGVPAKVISHKVSYHGLQLRNKNETTLGEGVLSLKQGSRGKLLKSV